MTYKIDITVVTSIIFLVAAIACWMCVGIGIMLMTLPQIPPDAQAPAPVVEDQTTFDATYKMYHNQWGDDKYCYVLEAVDPETNETLWLDWRGGGCEKK